MSQTRKPALILPVAGVLLAAYVGAYYALVRPVSWMHEFAVWKEIRLGPTYVGRIYWGADRERNRALFPWDQRLEMLFRPIHAIDRYVIRRSVWGESS